MIDFCNLDVTEIYCAFRTAGRMRNFCQARADRLEKLAMSCAGQVGANDYRAGRHVPPELFSLEASLCDSWRFGHAGAAIRDACDEVLEFKRQRAPDLPLGEDGLREEGHGRH